MITIAKIFNSQFCCNIQQIITIIKLAYCRIEYAHKKNDFAQVFKNLGRYSSENNFVGQIIM